MGAMEANARDALAAEDGGGPDRGGGRVRGEDGGHGRDGGGRAGCACWPGGELVGAVVQGVEDGEIRPLMTMLGRSMRRRCVPGDKAAWGGLRRTAAGLTE